MVESTHQIAESVSDEPMDDLEPAEMRVIDRLEDLRVIAHPLRVRIVGCLSDCAMTVRDL